MKKFLFPRLAFLSIKKNGKIYLPYIISCIGMTAMYYITDFLSVNKAVENTAGGSSLSEILSVGKFVIAVFAFLFLFYTNSFLSKRRNKEFGLYNILGMNKSNIARIITAESLSVAIISIASGLIFGIVFSKLFEIAFLYFIKSQNVGYNFSVPVSSVKNTVIIFIAIFFILYIKTLFQLKKTNAIELMNSENYGEKPLKANGVSAIIGAVLLIIAYVMAVTIKSPIEAIFKFLFAVILVIVSTYILFISGSVALCRLLKKNKKYYYKKNHFVSVSSMAYRMKRNGAGLASICILSIMVMVMTALSASLYFGMNDSIKARFPQENLFDIPVDRVEKLSDENTENIKALLEKSFEKNNVQLSDKAQVRTASISGIVQGGEIKPDVDMTIDNLFIPDNLCQVYFINEDDYNNLTNSSIDVNPGEAKFTTLRCKFNSDYLKLKSVNLKITGRLNKMPQISSANVNLTPAIFVVIDSFEELKSLETLADFSGNQMLYMCYSYSYTLKNVSDSKTVEIFEEQRKALINSSLIKTENSGYSVFADCFASEKEDFYSSYGGLFCIGILLSVVFMFAMAMIIYYKQISEGYEDRARFAIMQNVGMTKTDIKKSINSQTLTVFFAPLIFAGIHFCFAFSPIWKVLQLFNLNNLKLVILVSAIAFAVFGMVYIVIYKITTKSYYSIVASENEK